MWFLVLLAAVLLVALIMYTLHLYRQHMTPTRGKKINLSDRPNSALLIIDVQEDFTLAAQRNAYKPATVETAITAINDLIGFANENGQPVIAVRQVFKGWYANLLNSLFNSGRGNPKSRGLDIDDRLFGDIDHDIVKSRADAFSEPELEKVLDQQKIGKLLIVGLDGNYCVGATMRAAINRGYEVSFTDAATLALKPSAWRKTKSRLAALGARDVTRRQPVRDAS